MGKQMFQIDYGTGQRQRWEIVWVGDDGTTQHQQGVGGQHAIDVVERRCAQLAANHPRFWPHRGSGWYGHRAWDGDDQPITRVARAEA